MGGREGEEEEEEEEEEREIDATNLLDTPTTALDS